MLEMQALAGFVRSAPTGKLRGRNSTNNYVMYLREGCTPTYGQTLLLRCAHCRSSTQLTQTATVSKQYACSYARNCMNKRLPTGLHLACHAPSAAIVPPLGCHGTVELDLEAPTPAETQGTPGDCQLMIPFTDGRVISTTHPQLQVDHEIFMVLRMVFGCGSAITIKNL